MEDTMAEASVAGVHARLDELGAEIERKWEELRARGVAEGIEREAVSDMRMRHASLIRAAHEGHAIGELENGISELRLSFEHWLARIDADYARRGT
jgi:hypothetical protein